jgi:hypothetical protein
MPEKSKSKATNGRKRAASPGHETGRKTEKVQDRAKSGGTSRSRKG